MRQTDRERHRPETVLPAGWTGKSNWQAEGFACLRTSYNFCWPVRTLRVKGEGGRWRKRTPAMAAGLADHVWSLSEWVTYPARPVQRK